MTLIATLSEVPIPWCLPENPRKLDPGAPLSPSNVLSTVSKKPFTARQKTAFWSSAPHPTTGNDSGSQDGHVLRTESAVRASAARFVLGVEDAENGGLGRRNSSPVALRGRTVADPRSGVLFADSVPTFSRMNDTSDTKVPPLNTHSDPTAGLNGVTMSEAELEFAAIMAFYLFTMTRFAKKNPMHFWQQGVPGKARGGAVAL